MELEEIIQEPVSEESTKPVLEEIEAPAQQTYTKKHCEKLVKRVRTDYNVLKNSITREWRVAYKNYQQQADHYRLTNPEKLPEIEAKHARAWHHFLTLQTHEKFANEHASKERMPYTAPSESAYVQHVKEKLTMGGHTQKILEQYIDQYHDMTQRKNKAIKYAYAPDAGKIGRGMLYTSAAVGVVGAIALAPVSEVLAIVAFSVGLGGAMTAFTSQLPYKIARRRERKRIKKAFKKEFKALDAETTQKLLKYNE